LSRTTDTLVNGSNGYVVADETNVNNTRDTTGASKQTQKQKDQYTSVRVECGKTVFKNVYAGKPIPIHELIDCALCYVSDNANAAGGGCVLAGFQREEIMLFEERLAKKNFPPFGAYSDVSHVKYVTTLISNRLPDISDHGMYKSSISSYLKARLPCSGPAGCLIIAGIAFAGRAQGLRVRRTVGLFAQVLQIATAVDVTAVRGRRNLFGRPQSGIVVRRFGRRAGELVEGKQLGVVRARAGRKSGRRKFDRVARARYRRRIENVPAREAATEGGNRRYRTDIEVDHFHAAVVAEGAQL